MNQVEKAIRNTVANHAKTREKLYKNHAIITAGLWANRDPVSAPFGQPQIVQWFQAVDNPVDRRHPVGERTVDRVSVGKLLG